tara:strand:+ start:221 stop:457 length:237 start_codon:yes stop_codon:yes gene_type:complete
LVLQVNTILLPYVRAEPVAVALATVGGVRHVTVSQTRLAFAVQATFSFSPGLQKVHIEHSFASDASEKVPFGHVRHCV